MLMTPLRGRVRSRRRGRIKLYLATGQSLLVTRLLKDFEEMLVPYRFYRVHHSHVINLAYIWKYIRGENGQVVLKNGDVIDVARRKKDEFLKLIAKSDY